MLENNKLTGGIKECVQFDKDHQTIGDNATQFI